MDKTKHGLRISHFLALKVRVLLWRKKGRIEEEGRRKKRRRRKSRFGTLVWNISFVWNSCICKYGTYLYGFVGV